MKLYFIGGYFENFRHKEILNKSRGCVQNAANVFQENLLFGLDQVLKEGVEAINLPFVGSYPLRYRDVFLSSHEDVLNSKSKEYSLSFINMSIAKHFFRFFSLLIFMIKKVEKKSFLIIYSIHLPFLAAAVMFKLISFNSAKIVLIVPDLPEYMNDTKNFFYKVLKKIDILFVRILLPFCDGFSLLTKEMASSLLIDDNKYIVIEGVATPESGDEQGAIAQKDNKRYLLYSGTLAMRYGVGDLVSSFKLIKDPSLELWICGDGDGKKIIIDSMKEDYRIKYFGQLSRKDVLLLQQKATILVNPRTSEGEYTKYSFPSKIMEYMSSGKPVVMHRLPGIPNEYYEYCFTTDKDDMWGLHDTIKNVLSLSDEKLASTGVKAKVFVLNNKSPKAQAQKLVYFLKKLSEP